MTGDDEFERAILEAHATGERERLAVLYHKAGLAAESQDLIDRACFFFTQAYVFALEAGDDALAEALRQRLVAHGREE